MGTQIQLRCELRHHMYSRLASLHVSGVGGVTLGSTGAPGKYNWCLQAPWILEVRDVCRWLQLSICLAQIFAKTCGPLLPPCLTAFLLVVFPLHNLTALSKCTGSRVCTTLISAVLRETQCKALLLLLYTPLADTSSVEFVSFLKLFFS